MCDIIATPSFAHNVSRETMLVYICDHNVMCVCASYRCISWSHP